MCLQPSPSKRAKSKARRKTKGKVDIPQLVDTGTQTDSIMTVKLNVDTQSQTDITSTCCVGVQWPEYENNVKGEIEKCVHDHTYSLPLHTSTPLKSYIGGKTSAGPDYICVDDVDISIPLEHQDDDDGMDQESSGSDMHVDSEDHDTSYSPESSDSSSGSDASGHWDSDVKFVIFQSCLLELCGLVCCDICGNRMMVTDTTHQGTSVRISFTCPDAHDFIWRSQPLVNKMALGNLLLAAAIMFSGNTYSRIQQLASFMQLGFPNEKTYRSVIGKYICPVVNEAWLAERRVIIDSLQGKSLVISGDGRCDSPGFCAKYGTYTVMELDSKQIVDFAVVHVTEAGNSVRMEKLGLERCLLSLKDDGLTVTTLATDRHVQITSYMYKEQPQIEHQYDVWHMAKWLSKKLSAVGKKAKCVSVAKWSKSICNHLWWSAATCDGNPDILIEKFTSIIHHVCNVHVFPGNYVTECSHPPLEETEERKTKWLKVDSEPLREIKKIVLNKRFLKDVQKLTLFCHTGDLESYHSLITKYCPKRQHFGMEGMICRTQLAALDYSHNVDRQQAVLKKGKHRGELRYRSVYTKHVKQWVLKPVMESKQYPHIP